MPPLDLSPIQGYTQLMRQYRTPSRLLVVLLLLLAGLVACSSGHLGGNEIAFIRDGHLWTIDPSGANAFAIVSESTPVIGYAWSPTHQVLAYRSLDETFAKTSAAKSLTSNPITGAIDDLPSTINSIGIDGGSPIPLMFSSPDVFYSNPTWNTTGTRLLFREETKGTAYNPKASLWWVSQNDQPGGIAAKVLPGSYSIPSIASSSQMAIGDSERGIFTVTLAGTDGHYLVNGPLSGHPLPASLERVLWQPAHQFPAILYALANNNQAASNFPLSVQLLLRTTDNQTKVLATCQCTQFAWSPDGKSVLYSTGASYTVLNINNLSSFNISGENGSVPYWSPDSQFLLLDGLQTLTLVHIASQKSQMLLSATDTSTTSSAPLSTVNTRLHSVDNSLWATDSRHFLFLTRNRLLWQGSQLHDGKGLYTVTMNDRGQPQGSPTVVDAGNDTQAGWTYEDANTSFLY